MSAYYNEFDQKAAAWLRELIKAGHIAPGDVDERSITDIKPDELTHYTQCHFFAGIGGWSLALRLAGWSDGRPVWTASLPCQPFSAAGEQKGGGDDRNLWGCFFALVQKCGPQRILGEQVAQAIGFNWLDGVSADLEAEGYAVGSIVLGAHSVGAPHRRQRLYWMANARGERVSSTGRGEDDGSAQRAGGKEWQQRVRADAGPDSAALRLADSQHDGGRADEPGRRAQGRVADGRPCGVEHTASDGREQRGTEPGGRGAVGGCQSSGVGDAIAPRQERAGERMPGTGRPTLGPSVNGEVGGMGEPNSTGRDEGRQASAPAGHGCAAITASSWSNFDIIPCRDRKARRIESGTFPLANGIPGRVGLLRGYGNAIVPQVAAQFIQACEEAINQDRELIAP